MQKLSHLRFQEARASISPWSADFVVCMRKCFMISAVIRGFIQKCTGGKESCSPSVPATTTPSFPSYTAFCTCATVHNKISSALSVLYGQLIILREVSLTDLSIFTAVFQPELCGIASLPRKPVCLCVII